MIYEIGEECLVQDMTSRQWSKMGTGTVISVRTAQDGTLTSYLLDINGFETSRHRKYMRKLTISNDTKVERTAPRETGLEREVVQPARQAEPQLRRSERLHAGV